jgi:valyl-tRNA synthetase
MFLKKVDSALSYRVNSNEYFIPISGNINVEEEIAKLTTELNYTKVSEISSGNWQTKIRKRSTRESFGKRKTKEADALAKIETIEKV